MKLMPNPLIQSFIDNKLLNKSDLKIFHSGTRDVNEIDILIDNESGSLILNKCVNELEKYYIQNENYSNVEHRTLLRNDFIKTPPLEDDVRRYELYKSELFDKTILDFGCGKGGFLKTLKNNNITNDLYGIELNQINNENINSIGIKCLSNINQIKTEFDFIFLNHVFEHLIDPTSILLSLLNLLKNDGKIIIEIPHGNDFLIKKSGIVSFKEFTFWSEHICLYTEELIFKLLQKIGVDEFKISYYQRYNLNNHLNWFQNGEPGGHINHKLFEDPILNQYDQYLIGKKETDTLMIVIGKNSFDLSYKIFKN